MIERFDSYSDALRDRFDVVIERCLGVRVVEEGLHVQLSSLQLTVDENSLMGSCDLSYSCAYSSTLSWLTPTLPLMAENNPRMLERLFGASDRTDPRARAARLEQDRSLLDSVTDRVTQLQRKLGPSDNRKVDKCEPSNSI